MPNNKNTIGIAARTLVEKMEAHMDILEKCDGVMALIRKEGRASANKLSEAVGHDQMVQSLIEKHHGWKIEAPEDFRGPYDPDELKTIKLERPTTWADVHDAFVSLVGQYNDAHPEQIPIGMERDEYGTIIISDYAKAMSGRGQEMASEYGRGLNRFLAGYALDVEELGATFTGSIAPSVAGFFPYENRFEAVDQYEMYNEAERERMTMPDYVKSQMVLSLADDAQRQANLREIDRLRELEARRAQAEQKPAESEPQAQAYAGGAMARLNAMLREDGGADNRPDFDAPDFG